MMTDFYPIRNLFEKFNQLRTKIQPIQLVVIENAIHLDEIFVGVGQLLVYVNLVHHDSWTVVNCNLAPNESE